MLILIVNLNKGANYLMFKVNRNLCIACQQCIKDCPTADILLREGKAHIKNERCIKCGHCIAICPTNAVSTDDYRMEQVIPYNEQSFKIQPDTLLNFIKFRRSIRRFKDKAVEDEKILQIIEAGRFTQTGTNSQDVSYIVLKDQLNEIRNLAYDTLKQKGEYILSNLSPETQHLERYATLWTQMHAAYHKDSKNYDRLFYNAPLAIIVAAHSELNGGLASSNMELMTDALGLGTYFNGFFQVAAQDNPKLLNLLQIPEGKKIISCLVIGYPNVVYKRTVPRKDAEIIWL